MLPPHTIPMDDSGLDRYIGMVLRTGMLLAAAVVLLGGILFLSQHGNAVPDFREFRGEPSDLISVSAIIKGSAHGHPLAIIQLGLLLLIATPIARVIFSVAAFMWERDFMYVAFSTVVLIILLYSLFGPKGG